MRTFLTFDAPIENFHEDAIRILKEDFMRKFPSAVNIVIRILGGSVTLDVRIVFYNVPDAVMAGDEIERTPSVLMMKWISLEDKLVARSTPIVVEDFINAPPSPPMPPPPPSTYSPPSSNSPPPSPAGSNTTVEHPVNAFIVILTLISVIMTVVSIIIYIRARRRMRLNDVRDADAVVIALPLENA